LNSKPKTHRETEREREREREIQRGRERGTVSGQERINKGQSRQAWEALLSVMGNEEDCGRSGSVPCNITALPGH
jgi:hypothetical protein